MAPPHRETTNRRVCCMLTPPPTGVNPFYRRPENDQRPPSSRPVTESELVEAMRAGAHDYVQKQNLARLVAAIRRELGEATGRRRREAEDARREAQERFRFVVENTEDLVYRLRFPDMVYDYV